MVCVGGHADRKCYEEAEVNGTGITKYGTRMTLITRIYADNKIWNTDDTDNTDK